MSSRKIGSFPLADGLRFGALVLVLWTGFAVASFAQGAASIQGTVSDSSGGAVLGVSIRIKNLETGVASMRPRFPLAVTSCSPRKPAFAVKQGLESHL